MIEFTLNSLGMEALLNSPELEMDMHERVQHIAAQAKAIAPYDPDDPVHYRDNIEADTYIAEFEGRYGAESRVTGYVRANVPWATKVEVQHRTLGSALGNSGGSE